MRSLRIPLEFKIEFLGLLTNFNEISLAFLGFPVSKLLVKDGLLLAILILVEDNGVMNNLGDFLGFRTMTLGAFGMRAGSLMCFVDRISHYLIVNAFKVGLS